MPPFEPIVRWAGGKTWLVPYLPTLLRDIHIEHYHEPFLGGGAVFFDLQHCNAIINDLNTDLINAYEIIKSNDYVKLIELLKEIDKQYKENPDEFYYDKRAEDRDEDWPDKYDKVHRAARMIFLNRTCYNGLYRVNSKGQFNTPIGRYSNPLICDEENIQEIHEYLSSNDIKIYNHSYEKVIALAKENDIIYIDPPYDYEDDDGFTKYQMNGFTFEDFKTLKIHCDKALERGAYVIISNNATTRVVELFDDPKYKVYYDPNRLDTKRMINSNASERNTGKEIIFWGVPCIFPQANSLDKIVKLITSEEDVLFDKERAKKILEVNSDRQVSYYYSSLVYIGLVKSNKKLNDETLSAKDDLNKLKKLVIEKLLEKDLFKMLYEEFKNKELDNNLIIEEVKKLNSKLNIDTIKRRASTVKAWLEWIYLNE